MTTAVVDRFDIANYVDMLFVVYIVLLFVRILLSWIPRLPYNTLLNGLVKFVHDTTDPYLNVFRRILPPLGRGGFALDLSPIIAIFVLWYSRELLVALIRPG
ncbi:MAG: YggT family protein [Solirubrobacterales bacterium]